VKRPLFVIADAFSKSARAKIEAAGGTAQALEYPGAPGSEEASAEKPAPADKPPKAPKAAKAPKVPEAETEAPAPASEDEPSTSAATDEDAQS
jgi:hypothetical protein